MIDQQTIILVIIGAVLSTLMLGGGIIGAAYIIRPKLLLRKRMNQIGMIGDGGASDKAEGRRQRRIQEKVKQLKEKGGDKGFADRIADQLLQAGLDITVSAYFVISAVIGVADAEMGEAVKAIVVPAPVRTVTLDEVRDFCKGRLSSYKASQYLTITDQLPRNHLGKMLKNDLRKLHGRPDND